jgi:hypothetical protein
MARSYFCDHCKHAMAKGGASQGPLGRMEKNIDMNRHSWIF